jgi:hypothetical protein
MDAIREARHLAGQIVAVAVVFIFIILIFIIIKSDVCTWRAKSRKHDLMPPTRARPSDLWRGLGQLWLEPAMIKLVMTSLVMIHSVMTRLVMISLVCDD